MPGTPRTTRCAPSPAWFLQGLVTGLGSHHGLLDALEVATELREDEHALPAPAELIERVGGCPEPRGQVLSRVSRCTPLRDMNAYCGHRVRVGFAGLVGGGRVAGSVYACSAVGGRLVREEVPLNTRRAAGRQVLHAPGAAPSVDSLTSLPTPEPYVLRPRAAPSPHRRSGTYPVAMNPAKAHT